MERVNDSLKLARALHQAIIRQGTSIIDKQDIRTMHGHRVVVLQQGPDLALFTIPGVLARLAQWLIEAMRDRVVDGKQAKRRKSLPFVVACLDEKASRYLVVGVTSAIEFGDTRRKCAANFMSRVRADQLHQPVWPCVPRRESEM